MDKKRFRTAMLGVILIWVAVIVAVSDRLAGTEHWAGVLLLLGGGAAGTVLLMGGLGAVGTTRRRRRKR